MSMGSTSFCSDRSQPIQTTNDIKFSTSELIALHQLKAWFSTAFSTTQVGLLINTNDRNVLPLSTYKISAIATLKRQKELHFSNF